MARILGIDYGQKRTGLAVTDTLKLIASPLKSISPDELMDFLGSYLQQETVDELVIGYPRHKDGMKTYLCGEIDEFLEKFAQIHPSLKIHRIDESFSSQDAQQLMIQAVGKKKRREKGLVDMYSAVVLLRRHLGY